MGAADATLTEALGHLDTTWVGVRDSVLNDRHLIWIGSGVSRDRFPALPALLELLFERLHATQNPADPNCPYFKAAEKILRDYCRLDVTGLDLRQPPAAWPSTLKDAICRQLTSDYAKILGTIVNTPGRPLDIPFDILRLEETYSDVSVEPDAEHRFLALLVAEGAVKQIVTTNWDPLTERAYRDLALASDLGIIACTEELDGTCGAAVVFKIHGCAERTTGNPALYKPHMIATHQDILSWTANPRFASFFEKLRTLLRERPSLFVGISGQDFNLQVQFVATHSGGRAIGFPPARVTFSADAIGVPQRDVLNAVHGENYAPNQAAIDAAAALPLYGKPLFGALYVSLLFEKIRVILDAGERDFPSDEHRSLARTGLATLQGLLCARFDALPWDERWRVLVNELPAFLARLLEVYRNQRLPANAESYAQLHPLNPTEMSADPNLKSLDLHWFCLALASLSAGAVGTWRLRLAAEADGSDGQLRIACPSWETSLYLSRPGASAIQKLELARAIVTGSGRKVLVVYPAGSKPNPLRRNPGRLLPGGHPTVGPREVWFEDCARESASTAELVTSLKQEIIAAHTI